MGHDRTWNEQAGSVLQRIGGGYGVGEVEGETVDDNGTSEVENDGLVMSDYALLAK